MEDFIFKLDLFSSGNYYSVGGSNVSVSGSSGSTATSLGDTIVATNPIGSFANIDAGSGDDIVSILSGNATVTGGLGNDSIYLGSSASVSINYSSGDGNDYIFGFGDGDTLFASGGSGAVSGNNYLVTVGSGVITLAGVGSSISAGSDGTFIFDSGSSVGSSFGNYFSIGGSNVSVIGSGGSIATSLGDTIVATNPTGSFANIDAGSGDDIVSILSGNATVTGGLGNDSIYLGSSASVSINYSSGDGNDYISGFGDGDTLFASGGSGAVSGNNYLVTVGSGVLTLAGVGSSISAGSDGMFTYDSAGSSIGSSVGSSINITMSGSGQGSDFTPQAINSSGSWSFGSTNDDVVIGTVARHDVTLYTDGGYDRIIAEGLTNYLVDMGAGNDLFSVGGLSDASILTGSDQDTVNIAPSGSSQVTNVYIDAGAGRDLVNVVSAKNSTIDGGTGSDVILASNASYVSINGNDGDDIISVYGATNNNNTVFGGEGNDSIYFRGSNSRIYGEEGSDYFELSIGDYVSLYGGDDNDTVAITGTMTNVEIDLGNGSDFASINSSASKITLTGGADDDTILSDASSVSIDGGDGNDVMQFGVQSLAISKINQVTADGGAGNDSIYFTSSVATSGTNATIRGGTGNDTIVTEIANLFVVDGGEDADVLSIIGGEHASIDGGDGNDSIITSNLKNSTIVGGDGKDTISLYGSEMNTSYDLIVDGGDGDDLVFANTNDSSMTVDGGAGNDTINIISGNQLSVNGGINDDLISVSSSLLTYSTIYGDSGDDTIIMTEGYYISLNGGTGNDIIENHAGSATILGESGNDSIFSTGDGVIIDGGTGDDTIITSGEDLSIDAGKGDDLVSVNGGSNVTLFTGTGDDEIRIIDAYNIFIDAGGDADLIDIQQGSLVTVYGGAGDDTIQNAVDGALIIAGARTEGSFMNGSSNSGSIDYGSIELEDSTQSSGNDSVTNTASNVTIFGGAGNDIINSSGDNNLIYGGADRDSISVSSGSNNTIYAGDGDDTINILSATDSTIYGGAGNDFINLAGGSNIIVMAEDGNDTIQAGASYSSIFGGKGDNVVVSRNTLQAVYIETEDGDDLISLDSSFAANTITITTGEGNDSIIGNLQVSSIDAGEGDNNLNIGGSSVTVTAGAGNDIVSLQAIYDSTIDAGDGSNQIYSDLVNDNVLVTTGIGNDTVSLGVLRNSTLETGDGDDLISIGGGSISAERGSNIIDAGDGNDTITIVDGDQNSINAGDGDDLINFFAETVWGSAGSDGSDWSLSYSAGTTTIVGGKGNDTIYAHDGGWESGSYGIHYSDVIQYADGDGNDVIYNFRGSEDRIQITSGTLRNHYQLGSDHVLQIGSGNITIKGAAGQDIYILGSDGSSTQNISGSDTGSIPTVPGGGSGSGNNAGSGSGANGSGSGNNAGSGSGNNTGSGSGNGNGSGSHSTYDPTDPVVGSGLGFSVAGATMGSIFNEDGSRYVYITDDGSVYFSTTGGSNYDATISLNSAGSYGIVQVNPSSSDNNNFIFSAGEIAQNWNVTMGTGDDTIQIQNVLGGNFDAGSGDDVFNIAREISGDITVTGGDGADIFYAEAANVSNQNYQHEITITDLSDEDLIVTDISLDNLTNGFFSGDSFLNYAESTAAAASNAYARTVIHVGTESIGSTTYSTARFANSADGSATKVVWTNSSATSLDASSIGSESMLIFTNSNDTISGGSGDDTIFAGDSTRVVFDSTSTGDDLVLNWNSTDVLAISSIPSSMSINSSGELVLGNSNSTLTVRNSSGSFTNSTNINYNLNGEDGIARVATGDNEVIYGSDVDLYEGISNGTLIINDSGSINIDLSSTSVTYSNIANIDASDATATLILTGDSSSNVIYAGQTATTLQGGGGNDSLIGGSGADVFVYDSSDGNVTVYSGESDDAVDLTAWTDSQINGHYRFVNGNVVFGFSTNHSLTVIGSNLTNISVTGSNGSTHTIDINYGSQTVGSLTPSPYDPSNNNVDPPNTNIDDSLIGTGSIGSWIDPNYIGFIPNNAPSLVGSLNTTMSNYVQIGEDGVTHFSQSLDSGDTADGTISIDAANHAGIYTATGDDDYNFTFGGTTQIGTWNASLSSGDDRIHITNVKSGLFSGGDGRDYFHITTRLAGDVTLTGGAGTDSDPSEAANVFYAEASSVSSTSSQRTITMTDPNFDRGDVLLIDAGVENLTKDFLGNAKFFNYENATQAASSRVYAGTVFDASDALNNIGMTFSMMKMANRSDVTLGTYNEVDDDLITNVVWANSSATTIDFSSSQDDNVLVFTNTNGTNGDVLALGGFYNDTIYAGANDTIEAGDGNDIISVESGTSGRDAVVNGGAGDDTIYAGRSTRVVFDDSEGNDVVYNWRTGTQADVVDVRSALSNSSINGDGQLVLMGENQNMTIAASDGSLTSSTNIAYSYNGSEGLARIADGNHSLDYDSSVTYYNGVEDGTVHISTSDSVVVDLSSGDVTYDNILEFNARRSSGTVQLLGNSRNNIFRGGTRSSTLWGGGGDDTLIGGTGADTFMFNSSDGNVTIQNGASNDVVDVSSWNFRNLSNSYEFTDSGLVISTGTNQSLTIDGTDLTTFNFSNGTYTANYSSKTFTLNS